MSGRKKLVLIDGNSLVHRGFHAFSRVNLVSPSGENTGGVYGFTLLLLNILGKIQPDYIAVAFDSFAPTFRHEEYKDYKAHREAAPQELYDQIPRIQELLETLNIPQFTLDGFEADDIVGTLARKAPGHIDTYIATGDMDMLQLVDDRTFVYAPRKSFADIVLFDEATVKTLKGLAPSQITDFKGLRGDPSDNIPGVSGIGEITAKKLLLEFGDIEGVYNNLDKVPDRYRKLLAGKKGQAVQSKRLATIVTEVPIELNLPAAELQDYDDTAVKDLFYKLGFRTLVGKLPHSNGLSPTPPSTTAIKNLSKPAKDQTSKIDQDLEPILRQMERVGIMIDTDFVEQLNAQVTKELGGITQKIYKLGKGEFNINSPAQLAEVLFEKLKLPTDDIKRTKTGYSTAVAELEKLVGQHKIIEPIMEYRELEKLRNTYLEVLPKLADQHSRIHTTFAQTTSTGRLSSSEPNLQNIPIRTELGAELRKAFIAPEGRRIIAADYSQIELRVLAHISQDKRLLEAFKNNEDIHTRTAAELEGVDISEVTTSQRRKAKTTNFGLIYGISAHGLAARTGMTYSEAKHYITKYFDLHPGVKRYMQGTIEFAQKHGYVQTLLGRQRELPEVRSDIVNVRLAAERMAINAPIQGTAADMIKLAMIDIDKQLPKTSEDSQMILQVHDELLFEVPTDEVEAVAKMVKTRMEKAFPLDVPVIVDIKSGPSWGETKPITNA